MHTGFRYLNKLFPTFYPVCVFLQRRGRFLLELLYLILRCIYCMNVIDIQWRIWKFLLTFSWKLWLCSCYYHIISILQTSKWCFFLHADPSLSTLSKTIIDLKLRRPFIKLQIDRVARWCHAVQYLSRIRNVSIIFLSIYNCLSISFLKRSPSSLCSRCSWKGATSGNLMCGKYAAFVEHFTLMQKRDHLNNIYQNLI